jgi:hypothetical protein
MKSYHISSVTLVSVAGRRAYCFTRRSKSGLDHRSGVAEMTTVVEVMTH